MSVNSLPKTVNRPRCDCDLNLDPSAPESSTLTTRLPSHPSLSIYLYTLCVYYLFMYCVILLCLCCVCQRQNVLLLPWFDQFCLFVSGVAKILDAWGAESILQLIKMYNDSIV